MPARVFEGVRQRLLDDAVGGHVDPRGQVDRRPFNVHLDRQACLGEARGELVDAGETRLWGKCDLLVSVPQQPEQPAHLRQRLLPGALDRIEGLARLPGIALEHPTSTAGLKDDHADRVRDHIVELAGDARAPLRRLRAP